MKTPTIAAALLVTATFLGASGCGNSTKTDDGAAPQAPTSSTTDIA